jgi:FlaA1/EpsC-like NDP-sugar epimerase
MYKVLERLFGRPGSRLSTVVMVLLDVVFINAAFVVAYWLRYDVEFGGTVEEANFVPLSAFLPVQVSLTLITILVFLAEGLYRGPRRPSWPNQLSIIIRGTIIAMAVLIVIVFIFRPYFFSRLIFAQSWALMVVLLGLIRLLEDGLRAMLRRRGIGVVRLLLVGAGEVGPGWVMRWLDLWMTILRSCKISADSRHLVQPVTFPAWFRNWQWTR